MALIPRPHCGHPMSDKALSCSHCGKDPRASKNQTSAIEEREINVDEYAFIQTITR